MRFIISFLLLVATVAAGAQKEYLFIGTYTSTGSKGIYVYLFDAATGEAKWVSNTEGIVNPSYLAIAPDGKHVYACTETRTANAGSVSSFSFNQQSGSLTFMNKQPSGGDNPVYVAVHKSGTCLVIGNYTGGSLSFFPINRDGSLQPYRQNIQHTGKSVNTGRQEKAHVHSTVFSPAQDYLFVPDLGMDKVMVYKVDPAATTPLQPARPAYIATKPGSGPRHFTFHPGGNYAYLVEELNGDVIAYSYHKGQLKWMQQISTHPGGTKDSLASADIHVSPDGRFLYTSNRGNENIISIFSIDQKGGSLKPAGYQSTLGQVPRNFIINPSGNYLLAANQESGTIVIFKRNKQTGLLQATGLQLSVSQPTCLQMMPYK